MTNADFRFIAALLDRSGSMQSIVDDTCGGFDSFIATERATGVDTWVSLAQFDTEYELVYKNKPADQVPSLNLQPRGATALLDAIGRLIADIGADLASMPEQDRPGEVTVLVLTDGQENSSVEWTKAAVQEAISHQETVYGWDFVFLGANMDAVQVGADLGFAPHKSLTYAATGAGVGGAWASVSDYNVRKRAAPSPAAASAVGFDEEDRRRARGES